MVRIICILSANVNNKQPHKLITFEGAISKHNWPEWKKAMENKYNSLMKNSTWEVKSLPTKTNIMTGCGVFKLKKRPI